MSLTGMLFLAVYAAGLLAAFWRPIFGLATYVAVYYLHPPSRWWGETLPDLRWSFIAAVVTLVAILASTPKDPLEAPSVDAGVTGRAFRSLMTCFLLFTAWVIVQSAWALDSEKHPILVEAALKYAALLFVIYRCLDRPGNLTVFLWTHVLGCFYLGWIAFETYLGGRFEGFGGPDINESNAGGLQIVTGIFVAGSLLIASSWPRRAALIGLLPFIVNALITTVSRGGFLAAGIAGIVFNLLVPKSGRTLVRGLTVLGGVLFVLLTNPIYWERIATVTEAGAEVEGKDTGSKRLVLMRAQLEMFQEHPLGCGHRCTEFLSAMYLDAGQLTVAGARSSHNTFLSLTVEQGIIGSIAYVAFVWWVWSRLRALRRQPATTDPLLEYCVPAFGAILVAIIVGDIFVDYLKQEVRIWFMALLLALYRLRAEAPKASVAAEPDAGKRRVQ